MLPTLSNRDFRDVHIDNKTEKRRANEFEPTKSRVNCIKVAFLFTASDNTKNVPMATFKWSIQHNVFKYD